MSRGFSFHEDLSLSPFWGDNQFRVSMGAVIAATIILLYTFVSPIDWMEILSHLQRANIYMLGWSLPFFVLYWAIEVLILYSLLIITGARVSLKILVLIYLASNSVSAAVGPLLGIDVVHLDAARHVATRPAVGQRRAPKGGLVARLALDGQVPAPQRL